MKEKLLLRSWSCGLATASRKAKDRICEILSDTRAPPFVLVWKNKQKIAIYIRHQLDEEKPGDRIAMLGKDNVPFQDGKQEKVPSFTNGK